MSLTKKQRLILEAILFLIRKGELPTVREVGALAGLRSPATVLKHLRALEAEKLITISGKSRGIRIADRELLASLLEDDSLSAMTSSGMTSSGKSSGETSAGEFLPASLRDESLRDEARGNIIQGHFRKLSSNTVGVPVMGAIAAGYPAPSRSEEFLSPDPSNSYPALAIDPRMFASSGDLVALQVEGDSMIDAGILQGDYVILRRQDAVDPGEIAAVLVDGEVTLKRWHHTVIPGVETPGPLEESPAEESPEEEFQETVRLVAANERFAPITITEGDRKEVIVLGKYVGLVRGELRIL